MTLLQPYILLHIASIAAIGALSALAVSLQPWFGRGVQGTDCTAAIGVPCPGSPLEGSALVAEVVSSMGPLHAWRGLMQGTAPPAGMLLLGRQIEPPSEMWGACRRDGGGRCFAGIQGAKACAPHARRLTCLSGRAARRARCTPGLCYFVLHLSALAFKFALGSFPLALHARHASTAIRFWNAP